MARGLPPTDRINREYKKAEALELDALDSLQQLRSEFIIPTKDDLNRRTLSKKGSYLLYAQCEILRFRTDFISANQEEPCIYLCGNSLGLQPRRTADRVAAHLGAWATKGVFGHFKAHDDSDLPAFVDIDDVAAQRMAPIVGASTNETAVMETLTANLHLMMASFYRPSQARYKIVLEGKAFPSDHVSHPILIESIIA